MDEHTSGLSAGQRARIRRLSKPTEPEPGEEMGELNIIPYLDIIMNIVVFVIATTALTMVTTVSTAAPKVPDGSTVHTTTQLTVLITSEGVAFKTSGANVATGCQGTGPGIAVPHVGDSLDSGAITRCARTLKDRIADLASADQVVISANPAVPYQDVIATMDALREDAAGPLFREVRFGVVR